MKRRLAVIAIVALSSAGMHADVRVTSSTTVEGAIAGMLGGMMPGMTMHIRGSKARTDVVVGDQTISTIFDLDAKQITVLNPADRTARVIPAGSMASLPEGFVMPKFESSIKPTGQSKIIAGAECQEQELALSVNMADMTASPKIPPQAAAMMKDLRISMNGSVWVAKSGPGVAEYLAFQTASAKISMSSLMGAMPGISASAFDRLMESFSNAGGLPYLTEMTLSIEGGGEMAAVIKQLGDMKLINRVTDVSTAPLADELFTVPPDYKVIEQR